LGKALGGLIARPARSVGSCEHALLAAGSALAHDSASSKPGGTSSSNSNIASEFLRRVAVEAAAADGDVSPVMVFRR
jgi:hypothetical protein